MTGILKNASVCLLALLVLAGCKKEIDDRLPNVAPETTVSVREVTLADSTNLTSTVRLYWSGSDQDGFVKAYQISLDGQNWSSSITRTDSLFRFSFPTATDTATLRFQVRAVDDKDLADATPATIKLPLRNSPPVANWDVSLSPGSDTVYSVVTLPFRISDPDGFETIDSIFIRINGGTWYSVPRNVSLVSFVAQTPGNTGEQQAFVFPNASLNPYRRTIDGFRVDGDNVFEIQTRDIAQTRSKIDTLKAANGQARRLFVKRKTADLLVLDSHQGTASPTTDNVYRPALAQVYPNYDWIDMTVGRGRNQPRVYELTMRLLLKLYPKVFWFMDASINASANRSDSTRILLETVAPMLSDYIADNGKLLLSSNLPDNNSRLSRDSPVFGLLPVDSVPYITGNLRIASSSTIEPVVPEYPSLRSVGTISSADVLYPSPSADVLYTVPSLLTTTGPEYTGPKVVAVRSRNNATGSVNLVYFSIELNRVSGNSGSIATLLDKVLNQEFNQ